MGAGEGPLVFHAGTGGMVRRGDWPAQAVATHDLCRAALSEGRLADAHALAGYTLVEAQEPVDLYLEWVPQIRAFLAERGVKLADAQADERELVALLWPDCGGSPDPAADWARVRALVARAQAACDAGDAAAAAIALEASRDLWRDTHDRMCDWVQGMIAIVARRAGEASVGPLWERLMAPMFESYERYDTDRAPWPQSAEILLHVTAEALRGHLSGPGRRGSLEFVEEADRIGFRFRPCGSGGRNETGETFGTYPRTTARHDWAWNMEGVCLYCAHCCALSEVNPIRRFGYPAREVEPPFRTAEASRDHCTWWIYRDPRLVPEHVYARTGNRKPAEIGGAATRAARAAAAKPGGDDPAA